MSPERVQNYANGLVSQLERWHEDQNRGPLAKLRRGLSATTRHEASFVLGQYFGIEAVGDPLGEVYRTVAGCFALYPEGNARDAGDLGATMRAVMGDRMSNQDETHGRFRRLLSCASRDEICRHVPHAVRLAKSKEAKVDYRKLFEDLCFWGDQVKIEWTKSYWRAPEPAETEPGGIGEPVEEDAEAIGPM
jgi:CRISPR type I-E-associated protein CasB/Cse2